MMRSLPGNEILKVLRGIISGKLDMVVDPGFRYGSQMTMIKFKSGGLDLTIALNSDDELYHIYEAISEDGRCGNYDFYSSESYDGNDPIEDLHEDEHKKLIEIYKAKSNLTG